MPPPAEEVNVRLAEKSPPEHEEDVVLLDHDDASIFSFLMSKAARWTSCQVLRCTPSRPVDRSSRSSSGMGPSQRCDSFAEKRFHTARSPTRTARSYLVPSGPSVALTFCVQIAKCQVVRCTPRRPIDRFGRSCSGMGAFQR